jgi:3-hydroxyisobutyrate dehydrogenase-like beta-hydroxyacid dehydrogenase
MKSALETDLARLRIGLIGYGEVGKIFAGELRRRGVYWVGAWDSKFTLPAERRSELDHARAAGVAGMESAAELCKQSDLIICAVTAANTRCAAEQAAAAIQPECRFLDLNSASPQTKSECAKIINAAGGRYVEAAVMTSVPPHGIEAPMLLGGPDAEQTAPILAQLGMKARVADQRYGVVSAIKLCRSVLVKGLEALVIESFTSARHYGVEQQVLASLHETFPTIDWEQQGGYFFSRVITHGKRRAEEMREAAGTVSDTGLAPTMAAATAECQDSIAQLRAAGAFAGLAATTDWRQAADRILKATEPVGPA